MIALVVTEVSLRTDRQTDTNTHVLIKILPHSLRGRSKNVARMVGAISSEGFLVPCCFRMFRVLIKTCVAGLVLSVTRVLRAALAKFRVYVCMRV